MKPRTDNPINKPAVPPTETENDERKGKFEFLV